MKYLSVVAVVFASAILRASATVIQLKASLRLPYLTTPVIVVVLVEELVGVFVELTTEELVVVLLIGVVEDWPVLPQPVRRSKNVALKTPKDFLFILYLSIKIKTPILK